jgi:hypothetical protein
MVLVNSWPGVLLLNVVDMITMVLVLLAGVVKKTQSCAPCTGSCRFQTILVDNPGLEDAIRLES